MKQISVAAVKFGKEWVVYLFKKLIEKSKAFKAFIKDKFTEYFLTEDLNKD